VFVQRPSLEQDTPSLRRKQTRHGLEQRALARAAVTHDREDLCLPDVDADTGLHGDPRVPDGNIPDADRRGA
jgi:hypothetical protein